MDAPFVAVVTGSSSGIGRATAMAFAQNNAFVQLHGKSNLAGLCESGQLTKEYSIPSEPEISVQITAEELNAKHTDCSHINKDAPFYGTLPNGKRGMMRRCRACSDLLPVRSAKDQKEYLSLKTPQGFNVKEI